VTNTTLNKTENLNRDQLKRLMQDKVVKHAWLAQKITVSEKTLTRWLNGTVTRIRAHNLQKLAEALDCAPNELIEASEINEYSSESNRAVLVTELSTDNLLYQLIASSKIKLAISLIKSTFHPQLPTNIISNFQIKLGYAALILRKQKSAKKYFSKALNKSNSTNHREHFFSASLALAMTHFFDSQFEKCYWYLNECETMIEFANKELAHFYNTYALYFLYTGQFNQSILKANACITACAPDKASIEKRLFLSSALHLKGAAHLFQGEVQLAFSCCTKSLAEAERSGYKRSIAVSKAYLSAVETIQGNTNKALELIEESLELIGKNDISLPSVLSIASFVYRKLGNNEEVELIAEKLSHIAKGQKTTQVFGLYQSFLLENARDNKSSAALLEDIFKSLDELQLVGWKGWLKTSASRA
jgi:DNA-binding Xre family transcriptional regulator